MWPYMAAQKFRGGGLNKPPPRNFSIIGSTEPSVLPIHNLRLHAHDDAVAVASFTQKLSHAMGCDGDATPRLVGIGGATRAAVLHGVQHNCKTCVARRNRPIRVAVVINQNALTVLAAKGEVPHVLIGVAEINVFNVLVVVPGKAVAAPTGCGVEGVVAAESASGVRDTVGV